MITPLLLLALAGASPETPPVAPVAAEAPAEPPNFAGPKIVVPAPTRANVAVAVAHRPLIDALKKRFGPRVVDVKAVLDAQALTSVTATDLKIPPPPDDAPRAGPPPPPALARLAAALEARRGILVDVRETETVVYVYPGMDGEPAVVVKVPKKKADFLNSKWAESVAAGIEKLAVGALEDPAEQFGIGELQVEEEPSDVRAEIEAEEARDRARREAVVAKRLAEEDAHDPLVAALVGGGGALRFLDVTGPGAASLAPVRNGVVPTLSLFVSSAPLRAIPSLLNATWADALVELSYRKGFATVLPPPGSGGLVEDACPYDDDDLAVRASWRGLFVEHPFMPRIGGGAGGGIERVELGCALPVVSTSYPNASAFVRVTQPLLPRTADGPASILELDVIAGPRAVITTGLPTGKTEGATVTTYSPSWEADAFVNARPMRYLVARAGTRITGTHVDTSGGQFIVDDTRVSFELQVGGSF